MMIKIRMVISRSGVRLPVVLLLLAALAALGPAGCARDDGAAISYQTISAEELNAVLADQDVFLVNVHVPYIGEIPGTDVLIPYNKISDDLPMLLADKDARIVLYCQAGPMSVTAAKSLMKLGYRDVSIVDGGMMGWEARGHELLHVGK